MIKDFVKCRSSKNTSVSLCGVNSLKYFLEARYLIMSLADNLEQKLGKKQYRFFSNFAMSKGSNY